jgi:hypothetical protein
MYIYLYIKKKIGPKARHRIVSASSAKPEPPSE